MQADKKTTEIVISEMVEDVVPIRESDGAVVMYVIPRYEYGETTEQAIMRAERIADKLTRNGTCMGRRFDPED